MMTRSTGLLRSRGATEEKISGASPLFHADLEPRDPRRTSTRRPVRSWIGSSSTIRMRAPRGRRQRLLAGGAGPRPAERKRDGRSRAGRVVTSMNLRAPWRAVDDGQSQAGPGGLLRAACCRRSSNTGRLRAARCRELVVRNGEHRRSGRPNAPRSPPRLADLDVAVLAHDSRLCDDGLERIPNPDYRSPRASCGLRPRTTVRGRLSSDGMSTRDVPRSTNRRAAIWPNATSYLVDVEVLLRRPPVGPA